MVFMGGSYRGTPLSGGSLLNSTNVLIDSDGLAGVVNRAVCHHGSPSKFTDTGTSFEKALYSIAVASPKSATTPAVCQFYMGLLLCKTHEIDHD